MKRHFPLIALVSASASTIAIARQEATSPLPDESPMPPVTVWTSDLPLLPATDHRFAQIQRYNIFHASDRTGAAIANAFITKVHSSHYTAGRVALSPVYISLGNIRTPAGTVGSPSRFLALLAHENDQVVPGNTTDPISKMWTPWKKNGIAETTTWMNQFLTTLKAATDSTDPAIRIPEPSRFLFDDEPDDIFSYPANDPILHLTSSDMHKVVEYWIMLTGDPRFADPQYPVPGFGGQTLSALWSAAVATGITDPYVPAEASPPEPWTNDAGGSPSNDRWVRWFRGLMRQAEAGAMQEAIYDRIHAYYPNALCSDYDRSMRLDGANAGSNSWFGGDSEGALGGRLVWDGKGDLQAPCLYPGAIPYFYIANNYRSSVYDPSVNPFPCCPDPYDDTRCPPPEEPQYNPYPWEYARTNDEANVINWCSFEPFGVRSSRTHRFVLDGICRSFGGAYRGGVLGGVFKSKLAPWVPLPGQAFPLSGGTASLTCGGSTVSLPGTFGSGIYHIASCSDVRRTLSQIKSRGSSEFNVWSNNQFGIDGNTYPTLNASIHPQHTYNWSRLALLVDQVWGFNIFGSHVVNGTLISSNSWPVHSLAYAFNDPLKIQPATTGYTVNGTSLRTTVDATYTNAYSPLHGTPEFLRVDIEASSTGCTRLHAYIKDFANSTWTELDFDPTTSTTDGGRMIGGNANAVGPTKRVSSRIPVTADNFGDFGEVVVRVGTESVSGSGAQYVFFDLVQVAAEDDEDFAAADFNTDGAVDCSDAQLFANAFSAASASGSPGLLKSAADFNRDGQLDSSDMEAFEAAWTSAGGSCP